MILQYLNKKIQFYLSWILAIVLLKKINEKISTLNKQLFSKPYAHKWFEFVLANSLKMGMKQNTVFRARRYLPWCHFVRDSALLTSDDIFSHQLYNSKMVSIS